MDNSTAQIPSECCILAVDDDAVARKILSHVLNRIGCRHTCVDSGEAALRELRANTYDLVLTDITMPGMSGLDLIRAIRPDYPELPIIVQSGRDDRETMRDVLKLNADDFIDKPVNADALRSSLARILNSPERLKRRQSAMVQHDVREAQRRLMTDTYMETMRQQHLLEVWYRPLADAGGDFAMTSHYPDGSSLILLVDAAGHDIQSSYDIAECKGQLNAIIQPGRTPAEIFTELNVHLNESPHRRHLCLLGLLWNPAANCITVSNAGFPHPIMLPVGAPPVQLQLDGMPVGLLPDSLYDTLTLQLQPGDRLTCFSDGVEDRLTAAAIETIGRHTTSPDALIHDLVAQLVETAPGGQTDDMLILSLQHPGDPLPAAASPPPRQLHYCIRHHSSVALIEPSIQKLLALVSHFAPFELLHRSSDIATVLREALSNAVRHGNKHQLATPVILDLDIFPDLSLIRTTITDGGSGFDYDHQLSKQQTGDPLRDGQRGLITMENYADRCECRGNCLILSFGTQP